MSPLAGKLVTGAVSARLTADGQCYLNFYGSGYLAMAAMPAAADAARALWGDDGPTALAPCAGHVAIARLEAQCAALFESEAAIALTSGYMIGLAGIAALAGRFDLILLDEFAHYSLSDAAHLSGVSTHRFKHCDADDLAAQLRTRVGPGRRPLVVSDGVFAATGRIPPLSEYAALVASYEGGLFLDEAHGFGVLGLSGRGAAEHCGIFSHTGATFSKAMCAHGAVIGCSADAAERLRADPRMAALRGGAPLLAAAAAANLTQSVAHPEWRDHLRRLGLRLRSGLDALGFAVEPSPAPIVAFRHGKAADMRAIQSRLFAEEVFVLHAAGYVGCGAEGYLRCTLFRDHDDADVDRLLDTLGRA